MTSAASALGLLTVQMFWHGAALSRIERLCMASFIAQGHPLHLYVYDAPLTVPQGVRVMQAGEILPRTALFAHRRTGSLGSFSDWFRYRLLQERGGIWADTDVVCLTALQYPEVEIFGWQDARYINNAVLGLPAGHELAVWMAACCEHPNRILPYDSFGVRLRKWRRRYLAGNRRERVRWGEYGPKGLTQAARHMSYLDHAQPCVHFYPVRCENWRVMFESALGARPPWTSESRTVHLWQQMMRSARGFDKNGRFPVDAPFEELCRRYFRNDD
jgi:Alpha 1,4-glycosyltransferase conserved region/Glycosyltransferase sugar-binding region containing DXD motif